MALLFVRMLDIFIPFNLRRFAPVFTTPFQTGEPLPSDICKPICSAAPSVWMQGEPAMETLKEY
jgi:hypothetical protein